MNKLTIPDKRRLQVEIQLFLKYDDANGDDTRASFIIKMALQEQRIPFKLKKISSDYYEITGRMSLVGAEKFVITCHEHKIYSVYIAYVPQKGFILSRKEGY